jgi:hypothetical protein
MGADGVFDLLAGKWQFFLGKVTKYGLGIGPGVLNGCTVKGFLPSVILTLMARDTSFRTQIVIPVGTISLYSKSSDQPGRLCGSLFDRVGNDTIGSGTGRNMRKKGGK